MSYNRPLETRHYRAVNTVFNAEYLFVRFLEANGYDASYTTGATSRRRATRECISGSSAATRCSEPPTVRGPAPAVAVLAERYGIGFTDIVKRPTAGSGEFRPREFREGALSDPTGPLWHLAARIVKERGWRHSSHGATEWKPAYSSVAATDTSHCRPPG